MTIRTTFRLLACAILLAWSAIVHATPVTVHYALYDASGAVLSDASGMASGDIGSGSNWLNNSTLVGHEDLAGYLVKFWIDPVALGSTVTWGFSWSLAYGASVTAPTKVGGYTARTAPVINSVTSNASIVIGSERSGWSAVTGSIIAADAAQGTYSTFTRLMSSGTDVIWNPNDAANQKTGASVPWGGGDTTEVWAYLGGSASFSGSNNLTASFSAFGDVLASADVIEPNLILMAADDQGSGTVPEPGTAILASLGALLAVARRRKRRPNQSS